MHGLHHHPAAGERKPPRLAARESAFSLPSMCSGTALRGYLCRDIGDKPFPGLRWLTTVQINVSISPRPIPPQLHLGWLCAGSVQPGRQPQHPKPPLQDAPAVRDRRGVFFSLSPKPLLCSVPSFAIHVITSVRCRLSPSLTLQESAVAPLSICRCRRLLGCALPFPQYLYASPSLLAPSSPRCLQKSSRVSCHLFLFSHGSGARSHLTRCCCSSVAWGKHGQLLPGVSFTVLASSSSSSLGVVGAVTALSPLLSHRSSTAAGVTGLRKAGAPREAAQWSWLPPPFPLPFQPQGVTL